MYIMSLSLDDLFSNLCIDEVTADVTAGQIKQIVRTKNCPAVCVRTSWARGLNIPPHIR